MIMVTIYPNSCARSVLVRVAQIVPSLVLLAQSAHADLFHFNNFLLGDRAIGLGGAYTAIADDASAVVYNPAGMAFALASGFSGSANAFYWKNATYKDTIGSDDFVEKSSGSVPSFFGGLQQVPSIGKGSAFGFSVYSPDSDSKSQDDSIVRPELGVENFHRTINAQASTTYFGAGFGTRLSSRLAIGIGAHVIRIHELTQEYQDATLPANTRDLVLEPEALDRGALFADNTQNTKFIYNFLAVEPLLGMQFALLDTVVFGLTYRHPIIMEQELDLSLDAQSSFRFADYTPLSAADISPESKEAWAARRTNGVKISKRTPTSYSPGLSNGKVTVDEPIGGLHSEARVGLAWFASSRFLLSSDFSYRFAPPEAEIGILETEDVWNAHIGVEVYPVAFLPVRLGLFTNHDARPAPDPQKTGQPDHVDYYGAAFAVAWASGGSQIGAGFVGQYGTGKSQKLAGSYVIQDVSATFYSVVVSTSYTL
jgi:hypothetical protein